MTPTRIHFNKPQLRSETIAAPNEVLIAGRGTGKTEGVLAPKSAKHYLGSMPRAGGVTVGRTYAQLLTRTLPALIMGWERIGYKKDKHYIIGQKPSEKWKKLWKWEGPYRPPLEFKHFISWWNGAGMHMVSQDRPGSANGVSIDFIVGDEAKLLNQERFQTELMPANRGIVPAFAGNPYHHGVTLTTDMPVGSAGRWLLDYADKMDKEKINRILELQVVRYQLMQFFRNEKAGKNRSQYLKSLADQISVIDDEMRELRQELLYYHEASTLDNIHALGLSYIKQQMALTTPFQFDTQILNLRPMKLEDGYYPDFDEEIHGYFPEENGFLSNLDYDFASPLTLDCRKDGDLHPDMPLHIALDYNRRIHPLVTAQVYSNEIRVLKGLHALYPNKLKHVLQLFCEYYKSHKRKTVYYWYDQTAVGDQHESRICDEVIDYLTDKDWVVIPMYIGKNTFHEVRYRMWGHLLNEDGHYDKRLRVNRENCEHYILSVNQAGAEQRKDGFGKDKKSESDPAFPAEESTHYSEAGDTLVTGILESGLDYGTLGKGGGGMAM
ncbi:MAG TPA: hypothetical protein VEB42_05395 [Chitinophagaceae bacterium]|nr:hypothetical protein [Chitinophagaceae bacterium]